MFTNKYLTNVKKRLFVGLALILILQALLPLVPKVQAAALTNSYLRLDRMKASTTTGGTVAAKPATTATEADVQVTFPTGFTVNGTASNWTVTTTNLPSGCTAWPSIATATNVTSQTVTFPSGDLTVGTLYCFNFTGTSTLTTSTAGTNKTGTIVTRTSTPTNIDTGNYATAVITDDQISVTASVPATFSFTLSGNTDALGSLSTSSVTSSPTPRTVTVGTNANSGFTTWIKDSNAGLTSATASDTIDTVAGSCTAYSSGNEFYGLDADETTDPQTNASIDAKYDCSGSSTVGNYSTSFLPLASGTGPTSGYVLTLNNRAAASTINKAATDYADTITVTGAGNF